MSDLPPTAVMLSVPGHTHPLDREQLRRELPGFTEDIRSGLLVPTPGNPTRIDPDDAAVVGSSGLWALSDHQHPISTGSPSALTKTAASTEGSSVIFVRADHGHATDALPWGIVARQLLTTDSGTLASVGADSDFFLDEVPVDVTRLYKVHVHTMALFSNASQWVFAFHADGVLVDSVWRKSQIGAGQLLPVDIEFLWTPATGTPDLLIRVGGTVGNVQLLATTTSMATTAMRWFWVEDIGPR